MKKQFLIFAMALSVISSSVVAEDCTTKPNETNSCTDGKVCCPIQEGPLSHMSCLAPNSVTGGCP